MNAVWITLGIGAALIIMDWHMATKPDVNDKRKRKRRKPLSPVDRKQLRDLFVMTLVAAGAVWLLFE